MYSKYNNIHKTDLKNKDELNTALKQQLEAHVGVTCFLVVLSFCIGNIIGRLSCIC